MIDLHMHSKYSDDGEFSPAELVRQCAEAGITVMSITDHNCVRANAEAQSAALAAGIRYIAGIEIDCVLSGVNFHVLGYGIDFESEDFIRIEENIRNQERRASLERLEKIQKLGFSVPEEELPPLSGSVWTGELFAEILLQKPEYRNSPILEPYRSGGKRSGNPFVNFYWDYCSQGKPCYVKMDFPEMADAVSVIHRNAGKAILAHPGVNLKGHESLLEEALSLGLDGIEAFSSYHTQEQADCYYRKAAARNLLVTCGSDYHGKTKPSIRLGQYGELPAGFSCFSIK